MRICKILGLQLIVLIVFVNQGLPQPPQRVGTIERLTDKEIQIKNYGLLKHYYCGKELKCYFRKEVKREGKQYLRLKIDQIELKSNTNVYLLVKNYKGEIKYVYDSDFLNTKSEFWTPQIIGDTAVILLASKILPKGFSARISEIAFEVDEMISALSHVGKNDLENIHRYFRNKRIKTISEAIGKFQFSYGDGEWSCSGFLIEGNYFLTNSHCLENDQVCNAGFVTLGYREKEDEGNFIYGQDFNCLRVYKRTQNIDVILLELYDPEGVLSKRKVIKTINEKFWEKPQDSSDKDLKENMHNVFIIGHPGGGPMKICFNNCRVTNLQLQEDKMAFSHSCDTETGSSGSPVFDSLGGLIGIHNRGFEKCEIKNNNCGMKLLSKNFLRGENE